MPSIRLLHSRYLSATLLSLILSGEIHANEVSIDFDTVGGDAWTFDKYVTGRIKSASCDEVRVIGPAGSVPAVTDGERFSAHVPLQGGANELRAVCNQQGVAVAQSDPQRWQARAGDRPRAWIRVRVDGDTVLMDAGRSEPSPGVAAPIGSYEWRARRGNPGSLISVADATSLDATSVTTKDIQIRTPATDGEYYVTLRITDSLGRSDESTAVFAVSNGKAREVDLTSEHPAWIDRAVLYGAAPFTFGGDYEDVRRRLQAIAALGVSAIWLSPITSAANDDFGYAVTDHFTAREQFGSEKQLRALIEAAHALGMRVIMDFVPNHFANAHRYYADAERNQERSPYFGWFERDDEGQAAHYFDWRHLINLEYDHPEVQNYMIEAFSYWVREFGIDGFRVDVSWGVRERAPEFWARWRAELKRIDPDLLLIAEASALDSFYFANSFDVAYDWTTQLGQWAWHDVFADKDSRPNLQRLREALMNSTVHVPPDAIVLRFLNNNDTGARFISRHGVNQTRVAATMLLTLPGLPLIYNGDEVGAEFEPYAEQPISWRDRHGLTPLYTRLGKLRREVAALSSTPGLELLETSHNNSVLAYVRKAQAKHDASACLDRADVLVLLNFGQQPVEVSISSTAAIAPLLGAATLKDLLTDQRVSFTSASIHLQPFEARVLTHCIH